MIATVDISVQAANPSMPLFPMRAFEGSPSSIRVRNVPKRIGDWIIDKVYFAVTYPDNTTQTVECKLVGGVYVGTIAGCNTVGNVQNGYSIYADGVDENGNAVTNYCLGKGDIQILDARGITEPLKNTKFVQILSSEPATPNEGDMWQTSGAWYVWQDGEAWAIGDDSGRIDELSADLSTKLAIADFNDFKTNEFTPKIQNLSNEISATNENVATAQQDIESLSSDKLDASTFNDFKTNELTAYALSDDVENELATKADASSLDAYAEKSELSDGSFIVKNADGSTSSEKLVNSLSDEHSTRIFIDEHDNVIVQKYILSGWYVENVKVRVSTTGDYVDTTDYWVKVDVTNTDDGLLFNYTMQDYARTLPAKSYSWTEHDTTITSKTFNNGWMTSETGGQFIALETHFVYSATPIWVNVSRLVPDGSTQSGLRAAQIAADGTFVTPDQVEPLGTLHYAKGARDTLYMFQPDASGTGQNRNKWVQIHPTEGKFIIADAFYQSWFLSKYNGTTIDPPIEMKWRYHTTTTYYNKRIMNITLNSWGWVATSLYPQTGNTRNRFYIKATANDDGLIESIDDKLYVSKTAHDITFSSNTLSVATFDGSADLVECTRASAIRTNQYKYFVLEEDLSAGLSAKADVSSLNDYEVKADLPNDVSAIVAPLESELDDKLDFNISNAEAWYPGDYSKGDLRTYNGILYKYVYDVSGQYDADNPEENNHWMPCSFALVSDVNAKQDKLADAQISAIDSVVDDRTTKVKYQDNTTSSFNFVGELKHTSIPNISAVTEVDIGNSVSSIGNGTFNGCYSLVKVSIPDSVTHISSFAFWTCSSLTSVTIPDSVIEIGSAAFQRCFSLSSAHIGAGLTTIGNDTLFSSCSSLVDVNIPYNITSINYGTFQSCGITNATIPNSVKYIGNGAFATCDGLTSITLPNSITSIGYGAFEGCTSLSSVTIPESATSVGGIAFSECSSLTSIVVKGKTQAEAEAMLSAASVPEGCTVTVWNAASQEWVKEYIAQYLQEHQS